jgi:hypothetical protein
MYTFRHLIITTFNVPLEDDTARYAHRLDPTWLASRFALFEQYCFPSVAAQSNQNFTWVVYFDSRTPEAFKERIKTCRAYANFVPVYADDRYIITERHLGDLTRHVPFLITTKIDNDDAMARDHVQAIQSRFEGQSFAFLNFAKGYILCNGRLYVNDNLSNPFITLIEAVNGFRSVEPRDDAECTQLVTSEPAWVNGFKTAYCMNHARLHGLGLVTQVHADPMWLQVVHGRNSLETGPGHDAVRQPLRKLRERFEVHVDARENALERRTGQAWSTARMWAKKVLRPARS